MADRGATRICWRRDWRCSTATALRARPWPPFAPGRGPPTAASSISSDRRRNSPAPCFWKSCRAITRAILAAIEANPWARSEGIARLIHAHLDWVVNNRREARYLFEISRSEWTEEVRDRATRAEFAPCRRDRAMACAAARARRIVADDGRCCSSARSSDRRRFSAAPDLVGSRPLRSDEHQTEILIACAIRALVDAGCARHKLEARHDR